MSGRKRYVMLTAVLLGLPVCAGGQATRPARSARESAAAAQPAAPAGGGLRQFIGKMLGFRGGTRALDEVRSRIGASDEEWKVIGPKLQGLIMARRLAEVSRNVGLDPATGKVRGGPQGEAGPGRFRSSGAPFSGGGFGGFWNADTVSQAAADLQSVLDDPTTPPTEREEKTAALREAKDKVKADYEAKQKDLRELLTDDQVAVLVKLGYLE